MLPPKWENIITRKSNNIICKIEVDWFYYQLTCLLSDIPLNLYLSWLTIHVYHARTYFASFECHNSKHVTNKSRRETTAFDERHFRAGLCIDCFLRRRYSDICFPAQVFPLEYGDQWYVFILPSLPPSLPSNRELKQTTFSGHDRQPKASCYPI